MSRRLIILWVFIIFAANVKASESSFFPDIQNWKLKVNERIYNSGDLWELIDGAADIFVSYNFDDLHIAEYTKKNQVIRVELYHHKSAEDTYGIFTAERMPDYPQVFVGSLGYKSQGVLNFLAGNYYVKVMSVGVDEADEQSIAQVAGKVDTQLSQPKGVPGVVSLFPEEGKIALSDTYIAQNFMGYSFLHHAFTVKYDKPSDFQLFIIPLSKAEIDHMVEQYLAMMKEDKVQKHDDIIIVSDLFNGTVYLLQNQGYLIGVINAGNEEVAKAIIEKTASKL
jgi:hypothetical protein